MVTITADKKMPIPEVGGAGSKSKYPWITMKIGESFFVPDRKIEGFSAQVVNAGKRFGTRYTCRTMNGGVRVWRLE